MNAKIVWYYRISWHEHKERLNKNICSIDIARISYIKDQNRMINYTSYARIIFNWSEREERYRNKSFENIFRKLETFY